MNSYLETCGARSMTLSKRITVIMFLTFLLLQIALVVVFAEKGIAPILIFLLVFFLFIYTAFSVERTYYLFAFYVAVAPNYIYLRYFPGFNIFYALKFAVPIFALLLFYWTVYLCKKTEKADLRSLDYAIIIYLCLVFLSAIRGFLVGFYYFDIVWDLSPHLWYLCYFIFRYSPLKLHMRRFFDLNLVFAFIVSLEFIYAFTQTEGSIFLKRIVGKNIHLAQLAIPYIGATLVYDTSRFRKIVCVVALPFLLAAVLFSQQRALWFTILLSLLVLSAIFLYTRRKWIAENINRIAKIVLITVPLLTIAFSVISTQAKTSLFLTTLTRFAIFLNPALLKYDLSWKTRMEEVNIALADVGRNFIFGRGLGASFVSTDRFFVLLSPDNSYVYFYWKMGLIGLLSFISIYILFFKRCFFILSKTNNPNEKAYTITAMLNMGGIMIISFSNSALSQYEYQVIWAATMGAIEVIASRYD